MSEPEPDKRRGQRGGEGLLGYVYEHSGEFRRRREGRENWSNFTYLPNFYKTKQRERPRKGSWF